jgi:hypothetical protein
MNNAMITLRNIHGNHNLLRVLSKRPADAAENINFYPNTNTYYIAKTQNATLQNLYWFEVTVIIFLS